MKDVGGVPEVTADEDVDPDVLIAEEEGARWPVKMKKSARQLLEERLEEEGKE